VAHKLIFLGFGALLLNTLMLGGRLSNPQRLNLWILGPTR